MSKLPEVITPVYRLTMSQWSLSPKPYGDLTPVVTFKLY